MTLEELIAAYKSGELTEVAALVIDNDHTAVYDDDANTLFEMHPADLLEQALTLLGIPWEHV